MQEEEVDLFVVGAGSGGVRAARTAAARGARVAIAEERYFGGTCVNVGCVPKKLYGFAAGYAQAFRDSAGFGWQLDGQHFDWEVLKTRRKAEIDRLEGLYRKLLQDSGVQVFATRAMLAGEGKVRAGEQLIRARHILLATGGWPRLPDIPGRELAISSNEIFDLPRFPDNLLVVGGGYIAVEFASIFSGLGSKVDLSYRGSRLLRHFDEDLTSHFTQQLSRKVTLLLESEVGALARLPDGRIEASFSDGSKRGYDTVLLATGRVPNTRGLGLEHTAVRLGDGGEVLVDAQFRTDEPNLYAIGDLVGRMALTPVALAEAMVLTDQLFGTGERRLAYENIPTAVFSHPEIGTVGLSEAEARERGLDPVIYATDFRHLRHTLSGNPERTYMKVVVSGKDDRVLGMHMVGADAGEIIQGFAAAMVAGITKHQLDSTIGIHPTAAEEFVTLRTPREETKR
jgi:glutathione reductase (NADPH)